LVHLEVSTPSAGGSGGLNPFGVQFTPEEEEEFGEMARSDGFYERFAKSVAPSIFGSLGIYYLFTRLWTKLTNHRS
jgi:DNA replication licensing factor MCM5